MPCERSRRAQRPSQCAPVCTDERVTMAEPRHQAGGNQRRNLGRAGWRATTRPEWSAFVRRVQSEHRRMPHSRFKYEEVRRLIGRRRSIANTPLARLTPASPRRPGAICSRTRAVLATARFVVSQGLWGKSGNRFRWSPRLWPRTHNPLVAGSSPPRIIAAHML
jgi:hypothetical protein